MNIDFMLHIGRDAKRFTCFVLCLSKSRNIHEIGLNRVKKISTCHEKSKVEFTEMAPILCQQHSSWVYKFVVWLFIIMCPKYNFIFINYRWTNLSMWKVRSLPAHWQLTILITLYKKHMRFTITSQFKLPRTVMLLRLWQS